MLLRSAARTDVGMRRQANEDRYAIVPDLGFFLVADGMGGHRAGQVASQLAAEAALRAIEALEGATVSLAERLRHAVACANREIFRAAESKAELAGMGTTCVAMLFGAERLALAHVGDSRAYLLREGKLHRLTRDHTLAQQLVDDHALTPEEAEGSRYSHVLVNAVGGGTDELMVELHRIRLEVEDQLMLCTDGLYDMVGDAEIAARLGKTAEPVETVVGGLIKAANAAGGRDNVTVVLARF